MNYLLRAGCIWKFCSCNHVLCLMITALNHDHYRSLCLCQSLLTGQRRWWWACSGGVQSLHWTRSASSSTVHNIGWPCPGSRPILMSRRLEIVVVLLGPGDPVIIFYVTAVTGAGRGLEHVSCDIWSGAMLVSWSLCHGTESQVFTATHTLYWILLHNNITNTITILGWYIVDTWQLSCLTFTLITILRLSRPQMMTNWRFSETREASEHVIEYPSLELQPWVMNGNCWW